MIIDSHLHVWDPSRLVYPWLTDALDGLNRTVRLRELAAVLPGTGVGAGILVQAADDAEDTALMLEVAEANREVVGVVVHIPLDRPDEAAAQWERLQPSGHVVGVRNLMHTRRDPHWLVGAPLGETLALLERSEATLDTVAVETGHLEAIATAGERHPGLRIVVDHLGGPGIRERDSASWEALMRRLSENPRVAVKLSGLAMRGPAEDWLARMEPLFDELIRLFGPARLMWGSDWPISVRAERYPSLVTGLRLLTRGLTAEERRAIEGGTATACYRLDPALLERARTAPPGPRIRQGER